MRVGRNRAWPAVAGRRRSSRSRRASARCRSAARSRLRGDGQVADPRAPAARTSRRGRRRRGVVRRALAKIGVVVGADEDRLVIALHRHALVVAEVERGVEVLDETVGRAAADVGERHGDADFEIPAEAAMRGDRGAMRLAVDEEDRRARIHADDAERLVAGAPVGVAGEVVADPARLGEGVGVGGVDVDEPCVVIEHARALRLEKEEAVVEEVLIANGERAEQRIVFLRKRGKRDQQRCNSTIRIAKLKRSCRGGLSRSCKTMAARRMRICPEVSLGAPD